MLEEIQSLIRKPKEESSDSITITNGNFVWDGTNHSTYLSDINLSIPRGKLTMIVGAVGSGKSSLISAMIGEMKEVNGNPSVVVRGNIAYCCQQAWILNATVKENILFGKPFNETKYHHALEASAFVQDLQTFIAGDETEIGEKGINLSGGQKQSKN